MKNHYIPQTYLRRWADPATKKLCEHQRVHGRLVARSVYPPQTGYVKDGYTLAALPQEHQHYVEKVLFRHVDQEAANGLDFWLGDNTGTGLTAQIAQGWAIFLMSLLHRQPAKIEDLKRRAREEFEKLIPAMRSEWGQHPEHENMTFDEYIAANGDRLTATLFANVLAKVCNSENIGQHMLNMEKSVVTIMDSRKRFLTCDNPLTLFRPLDDPGAHILLPISPKRIFVAANRPEIVDRLYARMRDEDLVEQLNEAAISNAHLYVYDTYEDQTGLIDRHFAK